MLWISCALISLILGIIVIFRLPKLYPLRYLLPGLITFLFFMILPMIFTLTVAFTNLGTGHFLSESAVKKLLLETYLYNRETPDTEFKVCGDKFYLPELNLLSTETITNNEIHFTNSTKIPTTCLTENEVFSNISVLKEKKFIINNKTYSYFRSNALAIRIPRYTLLENDNLKDQLQNKEYFKNAETGFFQMQGGTETLAPGFYVPVGFRNFTSILFNKSVLKSFQKVILWTLGWSFGSVFLTFTTGLFLSLLMNDKKLAVQKLYRVLLIIPYSIPFFISVLIFKGLLNKDFGFINHCLGLIGMNALPWLESASLAKVSCLLVNLWLGYPYMFLVITGILQSLPISVYEAARLDGATATQQFKLITLPLIFNAIVPLLIGSFAFNLNNFVGIYLLTGGGPPIPGATTPVGETDILISYTYRLAFEGSSGQNFGLASAVCFFIFIFIGILTFFNYRLSQKNAKL